MTKRISLFQSFTAVVEREGKWFTSLCPELDVASQGRTVEEALANLREAVELYLEDEDVQKMLKQKKTSSLPPLITTITVPA